MNDLYIHSMSSGFVDFPGRYSVSLFFRGCNLRCPFCHNMETINSPGYIALGDVELFIRKLKKAFLGGLGIVFTGGEPTADHKALTEAFITFGDMPLCIHTNGLSLPHWRNTFESVVLSLKPPVIVGMNEVEYLKVLKAAMEYYNDSKIKHLRHVSGTVPYEFLKPVAEVFQDNGWEIIGEKDSNEREVVL